MSRPTKLTPEMQKKICSYIEDGNYISVAAAACGIDETTFFDWLKRGKVEENSIYSQFSQAVKRAEATAETKLVANVELASHSPERWAAGMTLLERRHADRWGRRDKIDHNVAVATSAKFLEELKKAAGE